MADFDDAQDKARRDLVALSAVILASAYLKPTVVAKAQLFGIIHASDVDPHKVWVLVFAVLSYFAYRYWHSSARSDAWSEWLKKRDTLAKAIVARQIETKFHRFHAEKAVSTILIGLSPQTTVLSHPYPLVKAQAEFSEDMGFPAGTVKATWVYEGGNSNRALTSSTTAGGNANSCAV